MNRLYLIEITPILSSPVAKKLDFFSFDHILTVGQIIYPNINGRKTASVVQTIKSLEDKSSLKKLPFQIKRLDAEMGRFYLKPLFIEFCQSLASKTLTTTSEILDLVLPTKIQKMDQKLKQKRYIGPDKRPSRLNEIIVIEGQFNERVGNYIQIAKELSLENTKLVIVVPNEIWAKKLAEVIKGIEVTNIVISTPTLLALTMDEAGAIVMEKESGNYRQISLPFIDNRLYIRALAEFLGIPLYCGDDFISLESYFNANRDSRSY